MIVKNAIFHYHRKIYSAQMTNVPNTSLALNDWVCHLVSVVRINQFRIKQAKVRTNIWTFRRGKQSCP